MLVCKSIYGNEIGHLRQVRDTSGLCLLGDVPIGVYWNAGKHRSEEAHYAIDNANARDNVNRDAHAGYREYSRVLE